VDLYIKHEDRLVILPAEGRHVHQGTPGLAQQLQGEQNYYGTARSRPWKSTSTCTWTRS
jgi:hypothetical protein